MDSNSAKVASTRCRFRSVRMCHHNLFQMTVEQLRDSGSVEVIGVEIEAGLVEFSREIAEADPAVLDRYRHRRVECGLVWQLGAELTWRRHLDHDDANMAPLRELKQLREFRHIARKRSFPP